MKAKKIIFCLIALIFTFIFSIKASAQCFTCPMAPAGTLWCDDFEDTIPLTQKYFEYDNDNGDFIRIDGVGRGGGRAMRVLFQAGEVSAGNLNKSFGRTPSAYIGKNSVNPTLNYNEIYWRMDVRLQPGWIGGGGDKLSRATSFANANWAQGMIAHLWSGGTNNNYLGMDPASGIDVNGNLVSTKYNDFDNLRWLGFKAGNIPMFSSSNAGNWYCVEGHAKLNTPGQSDGIFEFWINDTLQKGSYYLNWHGNSNNDTTKYMINTLMFQNYWNAGSPQLQSRYFDNIVISTKRIGCTCKTAGSVTDLPKQEIKIYPNPSSGKLTLKAIGIELTSIEIYTMTGEKVYQSEITNPNSEINLNLPAGMYFYQVKNKKQFVASGKLIIQ